jgi:hypothetical protein
VATEVMPVGIEEATDENTFGGSSTSLFIEVRPMSDRSVAAMRRAWLT